MGRSTPARTTTTTTRTPTPGSSGALQNVISRSSAVPTLPGLTISRDPATAAGLAGLEAVAAQPHIMGGASFLNEFLGPEGGLGTSIDTLRGTAAGDLVTTNPALLQALEAQRGNITGDVLGRFAAAGRTGFNPAVARTLGAELGRAELPLIAQDVATQQARQQEAARFLPGMFGNLANIATFAPGLQMQAGREREMFDAATRQAEFERARQQELLRQQGLGLAQTAGANLGQLGGTTTATALQQKARPSMGSQLLGAGLMLGGAALGGPMGGQIGRGIGSMFGGGLGTDTGLGAPTTGLLRYGQGV